MALDPSVILQGKQPDIAGNISGIASAASTMAALPGIQADSAIKQRAVKFNQWIYDNGGDFVYQPTDKDGNEISSEKPLVNVAGLVKAAADAGYLPEAQAVAAADLANQAQVLANSLTKTQNEGAEITNASNRNSLAIFARSYLSTYMDAYQKANPNASQQELNQEYSRNINGIQAQFGNSMGVTSAVGQPDVPAGVLGQGAPPMWQFDPVENLAMMTATMSPQVQLELSNSREIIAQSGVTGQSGPEYRDINSQVTRTAQLAAIAIDPVHRDIYANMTAAQLAQNETVSGAVMAALNPQGARVGALTNMINHTNNAKMFGNAADATEQFKQSLPPDEQTAFVSAPAAWFTNRAARFGNNPAFIAAKVALDNVIQSNPEMNLTSLDYGSLSVALRRQQNLQLEQAGSFASQAIRSTTAEAAQDIKNELTPTTSTTPTPSGTVRMRSADGRSYNIPANRVEEAKADGLTEVQ